MGTSARPSEVGVTCRVQARERRTSSLSRLPLNCVAAGECVALWRVWAQRARAIGIPTCVIFSD